MKKTSSIGGGSPSKLSQKGLSKSGKAHGGSAALVSDIGIVKKEGGSRKGSSSTAGGSSSSGSGSGGQDGSAAGLVMEDSFEKYYNKDLDLEEDQVPVVIYELNESAINFISQEQFEKALILLQKAQTMLDQIQADKIPCDEFIFLLTLHNMAMCYQKLGILEECSICLEACLDHLESEYLTQYFNNQEQPSLRLKMLKYKCKTHMQICALLSQIHKHKEAVYHSNSAIKIAHYLINECKTQCEFYIEQLTNQKKEGEITNDLRIINDKRYSLLEKTAIKILPIMIEMQKKMSIEDYRSFGEGGMYIAGPYKLAKKGRGNISPSRRGNVAPPAAVGKNGEPNPYFSSKPLGPGFYDCGKSDMKNILGYLNQSEWMYSLNIGNIMQISPLTLQDFMSHTSLQLELTREFILEKMCFLAVSYFCTGTEYRFLHQLKEQIQEQSFERKDSEYWHGKAVEIAITFLPSESPLVSHILMSYEKHHSPSNLVIPEDESEEKHVRIVRQNYGIDSCRLQPIIRYHPDSDFKVPKIDLPKIHWHKIYRTEEYMKTLKMLHKKQMLLNTGGSSSQAVQNKKDFTKKVMVQQNLVKSSNQTQRIQNSNMNNIDADEKNIDKYNFGTNETSLFKTNISGHKTKNKKDIESIDGDLSAFILDPEAQQMMINGIISDEDIQRDQSDEDGSDAKANDIFYKQNGMSQEGLQMIKKSKSDEKNSRKMDSSFNHSKSQNQEQSQKRRSNQNDSKAAMPPAFDKSILTQHRNSVDSEFNKKGRKLKPTAGNKGSQDEQDDGGDHQLDQQSSNSLDDLEFQQRPKMIDGSQPVSGQGATGQHRRARSSLGLPRKESAKRKKDSNQQQLQSNGVSQMNRGAILSQIRDNNSSSAMVQLQPRSADSGPQIPMQLESEDMIHEGSTYLQNHQSQPLSVMGADHQLHVQDKTRIGQSQTNVGNPSQTSAQRQGENKQIRNGPGDQKFKANPTILNGANGELLAEAENDLTSNSQQQFMGKRNQQNQVQQTAPAINNQRKKQANTINVEELQGVAQPTGNVQPQTATVIGSSTAKSGFPQKGHPAGSVRTGSLNRQQQQNQNGQTLGNTQLGQLGTAIGSSHGHGPSNNGFVTSTANIDQSSKNTINVYQFGSGVNFNLKLGPNNTNGQPLNNSSQNMSKKQYEQIQNALNSMNSLENRTNVQDRHNNSMDEKLLEHLGTTTTSASVGLKSQIAQHNQNSLSSKQYPTMQGNTIVGSQNTGTFNQMVVPSASSKRSSKIASSATNPQPPSNSGSGGQQNSNSSQRRKNNSQPGNKMPNFNISNQYLSQGNVPPQSSGGLPQGSQDLIHMMKKREKMNNSALAQIQNPIIDSGNQRKFTQQAGNNVNSSTMPTSGQLNAKIYSQKIEGTNLGATSGSGNGSTSGKRRQLSSTQEKGGVIWSATNNALGPASAQLPGNQRKQSSGGSMGQRKTSLEQKFNNSNFVGQTHHRQFSDISHQNLVGYKGIGTNMGGLGDNGPSGVSLSTKLQSQPMMSEHASMPVMATQGNQAGAQRFIAHGGGQGPSSATQGQIMVGPQSTDIITQIPSFIQRQQQQVNQTKFSGTTGTSANSQQKKAQAYLQNQQHQRR